MKHIVNCYSVEQFQAVCLSAYDFKYLKEIYFLSIKFLADTSDLNVYDAELDSVSFLKEYRLVILIVVMSLT